MGRWEGKGIHTALVEVEADKDGWAIKLEGALPARRQPKLEAMGAAIDLAARRYARTGED